MFRTDSDGTDKHRQKIQDAIWQGIMGSKIPQERERLLHAHWQFLRQQALNINMKSA